MSYVTGHPWLTITFGVALVLFGVVLVWLAVSGRRADRERQAEVLPPPWPPMYPDPPVWTPVNARPASLDDMQGRRGVDTVTQLLPLVCDERDATVILPTVEESRR